MSKEKKKLIPELRFPEFVKDGKWEEKIVGDTYDFKVTNSFSRENLNYENGKVKNIHYGDIHTKFNTLFDILKEKVPYINLNISIDKIKTESYCIEGDMIFADASEDLNDVGKSIEIVNLNNEKVVSGLHTLLARQKKPKLIKGFGGHLFKSDNVRKQIQREAQGAKVTGISVSRISNVNISYPKNPKEQQKIASCLSSLDEVIAAHSQRLDALKDHKKGLMQNLFPQEGKTVPKWRFKKFVKDGKWVEKIIEEFAPLQRGFDLPVDTIISGEYPVVFSNGILKHHNEYKVKAPGIVTGRSGTIGKVTYVEKDFWPHNTSLWVTDFCGNFPLFIYYYFLFIGLEQFAAGGGVPTLNRNDVHRHNILVPISIEEQQKIADCLSSLDALITAQAEKIEQLRLHKKGLMQGLFPKLKD